MGVSTVRLGATALAVAVVVAVASAGSASTARGSKSKSRKIDPEKPCTLLYQKQVARRFGAPVSVDSTNNGSPITTDCAWIPGDPAAPAGRLVGSIVFPSLGTGSNAVDVVESDRANAQLVGPGVVDLPLGKGGFVEKPRSLVEVAASRKFAFSLQWFPTGGPPEGSPITDEVRSALSELATDIARRGKRVS